MSGNICRTKLGEDGAGGGMTAVLGAQSTEGQPWLSTPWSKEVSPSY